MRSVLFWIAGGLLASGLLLGFLPTHASGYACGSAFIESGDLRADELGDTLSGGTGANDCDRARADARALPALLLVMGVAVGGAAFSFRETPSTPRAPGSDPA